MAAKRLGAVLGVLAALALAYPAAVTLLPAAATASALDDLEFSSDIRLRWRWVDSGTPGPLRSTYGELIRRGLSLRSRFVFDLAYPVTHELRIGGRVRVSNEPEIVLVSGPDYYASQFGSAFIAYETPSLRSRAGFYEIFYTPLTLMRWDLKDDAEGGACPVCASMPGTAGAIIGGSLEILGPVLTFEGVDFHASPGDVVGVDAFYARPKTARQTDFGLMRQMNTFGARLGLSKYLSHASGLLTGGLTVVRSEEDEGSVETVEGPPGYPPVPYKNTVYALTLEAPLLRWLTLVGEATLTSARTWDGLAAVDKDGNGVLASLDVRTADIRFENAFIYLTPDWESYFRALSYSPDRKGWRSRFVIEKRTWLFAVFMRHLLSVNRTEGGGRLVYPTWSIQGSYEPRPGLALSASVVYTGAGTHGGAFDFSETTRLYTYVIAVNADIARGVRLTLENRYLNNRDYEVSDFNYDANMLTLFVRAEVW